VGRAEWEHDAARCDPSGLILSLRLDGNWMRPCATRTVGDCYLADNGNAVRSIAIGKGE